MRSYKTMGKKIYEYVCEPRQISIKATDASKRIRHISVDMYINKKIIYQELVATEEYIEEEVNKSVQKVCDTLLSLNEHAIQQFAKEDQITPLIYILHNLKKVRNKRGLLIWTK